MAGAEAFKRFFKFTCGQWICWLSSYVIGLIRHYRHSTIRMKFELVSLSLPLSLTLSVEITLLLFLSLTLCLSLLLQLSHFSSSLSLSILFDSISDLSLTTFLSFSNRWRNFHFIFFFWVIIHSFWAKTRSWDFLNFLTDAKFWKQFFLDILVLSVTSINFSLHIFITIFSTDGRQDVDKMF